MRHSKLVPSVNAGSMADIAFLLLIFFLVTATISSDQGINRMLPAVCPTGDCGGIVAERNILLININNDNEIMVNKDLIQLEELKEKVKLFVDNNGDNSCSYCYGTKNKDLSVNPQKAVISLQFGKKTDYKTFIHVQNEMSKAFYELRSLYSSKILNKSIDQLSNAEQEIVKKAYPFVISEANTL
ncbi:biopolymer transporter ExbD [Gaetbulibacter sp. M240]|uniref:ExbD/TolR family protein n=1 Tax=Gaetbulibacter sp. M240 TaxID=3126511 RepID=UPI00374E8AD7